MSSFRSHNAEVAKFDADAATWWDPRGNSRWLHKYNPLRVAYLRDAASRRWTRPEGADCLHGIRILDIGCGAGVLCEEIAKLGGTVMGLDPGGNLIQVARDHALQSGVSVDYRCGTVESLVASGERFDVAMAMEVVEHVADSGLFLEACTELVNPGGLFILSTINRTFKSLVYAIVMGEYVLRLLPPRTHQWGRFLRPSEIAASLERKGLRLLDVSGVTLNLRTDDLQLSTDIQVNYMLTAERPKS